MNLANLKKQIAVNKSKEDNMQIYHGIENAETIPQILETGELRAVHFTEKEEISESERMLMDLKRHGNASNWQKADEIIENNLSYFQEEAYPVTLQRFKEGNLVEKLEESAETLQVGTMEKNIHTTDSRVVCAYFTEYEELAQKEYAGSEAGYFELQVPQEAIGEQRPRHIQIPEGVPLEYATALHISENYDLDQHTRSSIEDFNINLETYSEE